jgi:hypothetical protein
VELDLHARADLALEHSNVREDAPEGIELGEYYALVLFATVGMMVMAARCTFAPARRERSAIRSTHRPSLRISPTNSFYELALTSNPQQVANAAKVRANDDIIEAHQKLMLRGYSDAEIEELFGHMLEAFDYGARPMVASPLVLTALLCCWRVSDHPRGGKFRLYCPLHRKRSIRCNCAGP